MSAATIVDREGVFFLCVKNNETWDRIELPNNYSTAMATIHKYLKSFPIPILQKVKRLLSKMTQTRKLSLQLRKMTVIVPNRKKTKEIKREETSQKSMEKAYFECIKKHSLNFVHPRLSHCDVNLPWDDSLESEEEEQATKELHQDFLLDDPLKDVDDGDIVEDNGEADTSDQSARKKPKVFGPDLGKQKRTPRMLIENICPKPSVHEVKRKVTRMRKLQLATRNMNMKKTKEMRREETSQKVGQQ